MKFCRFQPVVVAPGAVAHPEPCYGLVEGEQVRAVAGDIFGHWQATEQSWPLREVRLLVPVLPSKIVCLGRNYREHAAELGNPVPSEPLIFLKPPSALLGPEEPILLPAISERVDYEGELAVVIGRRCAQLGEADDVRPYLLGFTCLNDVTARDLQKKDVQFTRAKGFDTFCPLGPVVETELDLEAASVETRVNGERRQFGRAAEMIFPVDVIIRWLSRMMTLEPGDVVATGTPAGVGPLRPGDVVEVEVHGVGILRNPVAARS
ncbi:MAG: fumarylacetoacetate hydrolase family protein [Acidobacteriia bacterium]|jgi:2-keto-4-pentenoate hydratase/2-oxohepta-3-ene-1,7-dioic acid hydratase in catechol pathway|nr:fumarylacetoacetate hydrolase family protein [Terriglobia bacterium]